MAIVFKSFFFLINKTSNTTKSWQKGTEMRTYCCWGRKMVQPALWKYTHRRPQDPAPSLPAAYPRDTNTCSHKAWAQHVFTQTLDTNVHRRFTHKSPQTGNKQDVLKLQNSQQAVATGTWKTAAAATSRQSCPTLSDPIDGSPPGSPVPGILQARALKWGTIAFSNTENR